MRENNIKDRTNAKVDSHCHIDLFPNPRKVVDDAEENRVFTIAVTNTPSVFSYTKSLTANKKYVRPAIGLHPELVVSRQQELPLMWDYLESERYIGEIGLDYQTKDETIRKKQRDIFEQILKRCADYGDKVLTIHSRRASSDVVGMIGNNYSGKVILHWYSGSLRDLNLAIDYGFFFSINTAMLKSKKGRSIIAKLPRDRVLTETDGPFIMISGKPAQPSDVNITVHSLAETWNADVSETTKQIITNFRDLLEKPTN